MGTEEASPGEILCYLRQPKPEKTVRVLFFVMLFAHFFNKTIKLVRNDYSVLFTGTLESQTRQKAFLSANIQAQTIWIGSNKEVAI